VLVTVPIVKRMTEGRLKIAIIEDEVILVMAMTLMLEDWGHQIVGTAHSEAAALTLVEAECPDVVVMDIRLGRRDSGLRVARLLRAYTDVPIVFCSAYADNASILAEVRAIDNAHIIGKPVDEDRLEWLLRRLDERRRRISTASALVSPLATLLPVSNDL
jgi:CheY-like chemotaxis protein